MDSKFFHKPNSQAAQPQWKDHLKIFRNYLRQIAMRMTEKKKEKKIDGMLNSLPGDHRKFVSFCTK